jgi:hypothetical protein
VGAAAHAREEGRVRAAGAGAAIRLTGRAVFVAISATVLALLLFFAVVRPAVERGGYRELLGVAALFVAILLAERWLRTR